MLKLVFLNQNSIGFDSKCFNLEVQLIKSNATKLETLKLIKSPQKFSKASNADCELLTQFNFRENFSFKLMFIMKNFFIS